MKPDNHHSVPKEYLRGISFLGTPIADELCTKKKKKIKLLFERGEVKFSLFFKRPNPCQLQNYFRQKTAFSYSLKKKKSKLPVSYFM